jgi:mono/diheme cytochrome c family protein
MNTFKVIFFLGTIVLLSSCSQEVPKSNIQNALNTNATSAPTPTPDELASAKKIYAEKCVKCHKETGEGGELDIEGTKIKVPSYRKETVKKDSDAEYIDQIEKGGDGMPKFKGKISDQDIKDLVKLIRRDFQK